VALRVQAREELAEQQAPDQAVHRRERLGGLGEQAPDRRPQAEGDPRPAASSASTFSGCMLR
jgi:hypothetical protein